ncbi:NtaA/DmoA family FMN-dependent monooxygenase [Brenneria populi]|uniref:NtaA/DmoA family FMN-dependent monooxygenase n=1 Tax=Brenneria populi TaxID=1505588 RepID=A0ABU6JPZ6_9GAMM|nr:NtaA/DmoA family FMN-dependent monooxygenase [Brenneria populi Li et al. 2015]MEC5342582.1 NtaA/DmoA family FMN-dependent monooxygenase [Brenneria populi Li et al. 2015]
MAANRPLCIGMSIAVTWLTGNGWRRADSRVEDIYSPDFYIDLAKRAENAKLDFLFRPDTLFIDPQSAARSPSFSSLDPSVLLAAIAGETRRIGLVSTASTTFYPPYIVARQIQSLNWISRGRAGWNVVTALDGQRNFGLDSMPPSRERYEKALEFTDVVRRLWQSYPHDALAIDRCKGEYAQADRLRPIGHRGRFFSVEGPLNVPDAGSGAIPLFQAGASDWGRDFAARIADGVFAATPDSAAGVELRADLRRRAQAHGRRPDAIRLLPGLSLYLGKNRREARELYQETHANLALERRYAGIREMLGVDLSRLPPDQPITARMLPAPLARTRSQTHADLLRRLILRERLTVGELLQRPEVIGSAHWLVVGTAEDALREIIARTQAGAADGFIALPGGSPASLDCFFDDLLPLLVEQGLFRRDYDGATLRQHLGMDPPSQTPTDR